MILRQFKVQAFLRVAGLFAALLLLAFGVAEGVREILLVIPAVASVYLAVSLLRYVNRGNREMESYLRGLRFGDFQQTCSIAHLGPSFESLEEALQETAVRFKQLRTDKERQDVYNQALVQHIPLPFFIVRPDGRVRVLNNATRKTFNVADITNTEELARFGAGFQRDVLQVRPGEALLTTIELAGAQEHFIMTATQITAGGGPDKLISLQNVQSQIDATELATWQNLLRVTSHEIINSLAPVSSSAQGAKMLVDEALASGIDDTELREDMKDVQASLDTVLRRSEGLTRFIKSYRQLSRLPQPQRREIALSDYFRHLDTLVRDDLAQKNIDLRFHCQPGDLSLSADRDMLDQLSINLIRNAAEALAGKTGARIDVAAAPDEKRRIVLEFRDNGPGIPSELSDRIFLPFFTSKKQGSGIGLALVRYIMLSHGGTVTYESSGEGGSSFRLFF